MHYCTDVNALSGKCVSWTVLERVGKNRLHLVITEEGGEVFRFNCKSRLWMEKDFNDAADRKKKVLLRLKRCTNELSEKHEFQLRLRSNFEIKPRRRKLLCWSEKINLNNWSNVEGWPPWQQITGRLLTFVLKAISWAWRAQSLKHSSVCAPLPHANGVVLPSINRGSRA